MKLSMLPHIVGSIDWRTTLSKAFFILCRRLRVTEASAGVSLSILLLLFVEILSYLPPSPHSQSRLSCQLKKVKNVKRQESPAASVLFKSTQYEFFFSSEVQLSHKQ